MATVTIHDLQLTVLYLYDLYASHGSSRHPLSMSFLLRCFLHTRKTETEFMGYGKRTPDLILPRKQTLTLKQSQKAESCGIARRPIWFLKCFYVGDIRHGRRTL